MALTVRFFGQHSRWYRKTLTTSSCGWFKDCKGCEAMNAVQMDGFFSSLIAGPETVMPSTPPERSVAFEGVGLLTELHVHVSTGPA